MTDTANVSKKIAQVAAYSVALVVGVLALVFLLPWLMGLLFPTPAPAPRPAPVARVEPTPVPQLGQIERIRAALANEIKAGSITVDPFGAWIAIRVGNLISFESGQASVVPGFVPVGRRIAEIVEKEKGAVRVVGHTDDQALGGGGQFRDNQALSVARATAVANLLKAALTDGARVAVEGRGSSEPIAANATADGRARNRRVEVLVTRAE